MTINLRMMMPVTPSRGIYRAVVSPDQTRVPNERHAMPGRRRSPYTRNAQSLCGRFSAARDGMLLWAGRVAACAPGSRRWQGGQEIPQAAASASAASAAAVLFL